jgi:phenylacetate-CoA ligase
VTGKVLPDGERGELVFTSLTKEAFPIIRYRTRDLTRLLPGTARSMRRMEKVTGRSDDMMIIRGVNVFPTQIEELLLRCDKLAPHYQIELTRDERLDVMLLMVEAREGASDTDSKAEGGRLAELIKNNIGVSAKVNVAAPGGVERSAGKARRIVDKRPKD